MSKQQTVDPPMVPYAIGGIVAFTIAALIIWVADGPTQWLQVCIAGALWGTEPPDRRSLQLVRRR